MTELLCPVCDKPMHETETKNLFSCTRTTVHVPELDLEVETLHAMYYMNPEGRATIKTIEVLPYSFEIHDDPKSIRQTRIFRIVASAKADTKTHWVSYGGRRFLREELIMVPGVVNCQWNDRANVLDRVKMYMLFS